MDRVALLEKHATALKQVPEAQLWSICSNNLKKAQEFVIRHEAQASVNAFTDVSKMLLDPNLGAIIIATPDKLHVDPILLSIKAEKPILVEKPVCTSINSCEEILSAYQKHKNKIVVGYHL